MPVGALITPVVYRSEVEIGLQLPVGALNLTDEIVVVPCGLLVQIRDIGTQEVCSIYLLLWHLQLPSHGCGIAGPVILLHIYSIIAHNGWESAFKLAYALEHSLVFLRAALLCECRGYGCQSVLEVAAKVAVHALCLQSLGRRVDLQEVIYGQRLCILQTTL